MLITASAAYDSARLFPILLDDIPMASNDADHDWWVYSTALADGVILVKCRKTGARGSIDDPTRAEWNRAWSAPSNPYPWTDAARVRIET